MSRYKFSDIAINVNEKRMPVPEDKFLYIAPNNLDTDTLTVPTYGYKVNLNGTKLIMHKGDMLFGRREPQLKKAAIAPHDGLFSAHGMIFHPKEDVIIPEFFPFFISSDYFMDEAIRISVGSLSPTVNWKDLKDIEFYIPPIEKQKEYAELLWGIIRSKKAYKELIKQTDELVKSQFIEMFGDPVKNPMGWQKKQLQELVTDDCTISYGIVQTGDDQAEGIPVFRPVDVVGGTPSLANLKKTTKEISDKYKRTLLHGRELLITVRANIADTCIIGEEFRGCNVGRGIVPIRTNEEIMPLEFLKGQMDYDSMNQYMKSLAKGVTLIQLNMDDLRKVELVVPPIYLQKKYIAFMEQSDKSKFVAEQSIRDLNISQKSIVEQIFSD